MSSFYDQLSPFYHVIFEDWNASVERQGSQLKTLIQSNWPHHKTILDVSCGIGTQAIGLSKNGYEVTASDLSMNEIERAKREAQQCGQTNISFSVIIQFLIFSQMMTFYLPLNKCIFVYDRVVVV
jgi:2-polyprenyl-3-methyl-5-hydroxy-6-metoxy-1,4-benzoquinol methylase